MSPETLKSNLARIAEALGFAACRVARAGPAAHEDLYRRWIDDGCHGDMEWMARNADRRTDPRAVLPGCRSVVMLATNYFQGPPPANVAAGPAGRFARYAWGDDYHDLLLARLGDLETWLAEAGGAQRCYVDTGPVLERDFASEAGIGWNGKSTVQIDRRLGTWFFLSEILTTLELPPDAPEPDRCGSCTRCLDACPTDAITAPRRLDARRCISYLTIEHRGPIPHEFRRAIGDRIYGCDDCLEACPWNRFARAGREAAFQARDHLAMFSLTDYLDLTEDEFRALFRHTPVRRTGWSRFRRNVCVALGNVGSERDQPALERAAAGDDPLVAEHARWALGEIRSRWTPARSPGPPNVTASSPGR